MRRAMILASLPSVVTVGLWPPGLARAGNPSIGVQTDSVHLGMHIGGPQLGTGRGPLMVIAAGPSLRA